MQSAIERLKKDVERSQRIVFFGGAGVSTESGIPDFRSPDGLYHQKYKYPPETMLSHDFFVGHTKEFFDFYRDKMLVLDAQPNIIHKKLAEWERDGKLTAVVTQNIDGLHQKAGSENVLELHGSIYRNHCIRCHKAYGPDYIKKSEGVPVCAECGGIIKPDVVLYGESLPDGVVESSIEHIARADMLIIGGTSLAVYPAAGLIRYYGGDRLVLINKSQTPYDSEANIVINDSLGKVFAQL